jgi:hypothetical protein
MRSAPLALEFASAKIVSRLDIKPGLHTESCARGPITLGNGNKLLKERITKEAGVTEFRYYMLNREATTSLRIQVLANYMYCTIRIFISAILRARLGSLSFILES